jgi:Lecithin retinol acyltransferase
VLSHKRVGIWSRVIEESMITNPHEKQKRRHKTGDPVATVPAEDVLEADHEPPIGAHLMTQRWSYTHHGIYVGRRRVVQYGGLSLGLRRGPVEEVTLSEFASGRPIRIRSSVSASIDCDEVVRRARSRRTAKLPG